MADPTYLVYAPYSFSGRGPAESCARIVAGAATAGLHARVYAGRVRVRLTGAAEVVEPFGALGRAVPWGRIERAALDALDRRFLADLAHVDPTSTVLHVWPGTPARVIRAARDAGVVTVREMINSACATARPLLDAAYERLGLPATHPVTAEAVAGESAELRLVDYAFASNPEVERSLLDVGMRPEQILPTTFGWEPRKYDPALRDRRLRDEPGLRALFLGRVGVRKGVPELLDAWGAAQVPGELVVAGPIDSEIAPLIARAGTGVRVVGPVSDPTPLYAAADVFVFPTLEEGGPQVTYEAAGCGLPVITTPMGAARLIETGRNGVVVPPASPGALADALRLLAAPERRRGLGDTARTDAARFTYRRVGARRAEQLRGVLARPRQPVEPPTD